MARGRPKKNNIEEHVSEEIVDTAGKEKGSMVKITLLCNYGDKRHGEVVTVDQKTAEELISNVWAK